jgi:hypothetical protein
MNLTAFSLSANSNSKVDGNQISFGTIGFQPHPPTLTSVFASLDQEMDLTIGSLSFHIGSLGSIRLPDPMKSDPSAGKTVTMAISESSVGSSSKVNSPVSFATTENIEDKIEELDETMENLDLGKQSEDFMICCRSISDNSTNTWKTGLELQEDNQTTLSSCRSKLSNQYQILAIIGDNAEELDDNNNPVLNPANVTRGANHLAEGDTADSFTNRTKIWLSSDVWNTIKAAIEHGAATPVDASKDVLLGYHYALPRQSRQLAKERSEIRKRRDSTIAASAALHEARSNASHTNSRRNNRHESRVENLDHSDRRNLSRNLDSSFLSVDEQGNVMRKTPEVALVAAQTYIYTTQPNPGDPREHMHRSALQGLRLVGNKLTTKDEEAYRNKGTHKPRSPRRHNSPRHRSSSRRSRSSSPGYYKSLRHGGTRRSRTPTKANDYEDDEKEMGATCFTCRVCTTPVPKGFKLPHDQQKYDGSQEPQSWLSDYYKQSEY